MHAFIPGFCVDTLEDRIIPGKQYIIKNFTVQKYKQTDIFRSLRNENQLIFSKDTKIEEIEERGTNIPHKVFDFYDHIELKPLTTQKTHLAGNKLSNLSYFIPF